MQKHIIGSALFVLIFSSFAFVYALVGYRSAPVSEVVISEADDLTVRVGSSYYELDSGTLTTRIRLDWTGASAPPNRVFIRSEVYIAGAAETLTDQVYKEIRHPFSDSRSAQVSVESTYPALDRTGSNLYVRVGAGVERDRTTAAPLVSPVLFVHGERSKVRN